VTLVVALACQDGCVFASDGQATVYSSGGPIKQPIQKIKKLGDHTLWGASGSLGLIQRIGARLDSVPTEYKNAGLDNLVSDISGIVYQLRGETLQRHRNLYGQERDHEAETVDLLLAEYRGGNSRILHVTRDGITEFLEEIGIGASGIGDTFAYTILKGFNVRQLTVDAGKVLAYRVIRDAIDVGAFGLGEPIDIWVITEQGAKQMSPEEMAAIRDTHKLWMEADAETFQQLFRR
jgi:proteasome beta subunit